VLAGAAQTAQLAGKQVKAARYTAQLRALAFDEPHDRAAQTQALAAPPRN
jgi:hypothetical protein